MCGTGRIRIMKKIISVLLAAAALVTMTACGAKKTETASDMDYIKDKGNMVIGYTLFAPMNYMENGELIGFETDLAKAVCEKLGVEAKFQEINWDSKEMELNSKTIDCIWNGMTITDERKENMSISEPYMGNRQVIVVKKDKADALGNSLDGAKVVAEAGSAGEETAKSDSLFEKAEFTAVDSQAKGLMEVKAGVSDAVVLDYIMALGSVGEGTDYSDLTIIDKNFEEEEYGIAFRKGSDVTAKVDEAVKELAADGTLKQIADRYKLTDLLLIK